MVFVTFRYRTIDKVLHELVALKIYALLINHASIPEVGILGNFVFVVEKQNATLFRNVVKPEIPITLSLDLKSSYVNATDLNDEGTRITYFVEEVQTIIKKVVRL